MATVNAAEGSAVGCTRALGYRFMRSRVGHPEAEPTGSCVVPPSLIRGTAGKKREFSEMMVTECSQEAVAIAGVVKRGRANSRLGNVGGGGRGVGVSQFVAYSGGGGSGGEGDGGCDGLQPSQNRRKRR